MPQNAPFAGVSFLKESGSIQKYPAFSYKMIVFKYLFRLFFIQKEMKGGSDQGD